MGVNPNDQFEIQLDNLGYTLLLGPLFVLTGIVHEYGHALACLFFGVPIERIIYSILNFKIIHGVSSIAWVNIAIKLYGGLFASIISLPMIWLIPKNFKFRNEIRTSIITYVIYHLFNGIIEGFFTEFYDKHIWIMVFPFLFSIYFSVNLYKFLYRYEYEKKHYS